jgi:hypothetical protein
MPCNDRGFKTPLFKGRQVASCPSGPPKEALTSLVCHEPLPACPQALWLLRLLLAEDWA